MFSYENTAFKSLYWSLHGDGCYLSLSSAYCFNLFPEFNMFGKKDRMSWKAWYPIDEDDKIRPNYWDVLR